MSSIGQYRETQRRLRDLLTRQEERRGFLVVFEGPDGSGKTTQRKLFKTWLVNEGYQVVTTKWNSSPLVKPLIRARKNARALSPREFSLLHAADFRQRLETEILPALWQGKVVVADRYIFTALARDAARSLDIDWLLRMYLPLFWPDMVFYFSVSPETSGHRIAAVRSPKFYEAGQDVTDLDDPLESYKLFISRVIQEYDALAKIFRFVTVDAERTIHEQHHEIRRLFREGQRRAWAEWNVDAVLDWLGRQPGMVAAAG